MAGEGTFPDSADRRTRCGRRPGRTCAGTPNPTQNRRSANAYGYPGHHPHHAQARLYRRRAPGGRCRSESGAHQPAEPVTTREALARTRTSVRRRWHQTAPAGTSYPPLTQKCSCPRRAAGLRDGGVSARPTPAGHLRVRAISSTSPKLHTTPRAHAWQDRPADESEGAPGASVRGRASPGRGDDAPVRSG